MPARPFGTKTKYQRMKRILSSLALLGLAAPAVFGASLTTFRVCEEKRTLKTSDGADA